MKIWCCSYSMADRPSSNKDKLLTWFQDHNDVKIHQRGCLAIAAMPDTFPVIAAMPVWVQAGCSSSSLLPFLLLLYTLNASLILPKPWILTAALGKSSQVHIVQILLESWHGV